MYPSDQKSVVVGGEVFDLQPNEVSISYKEWCNILGCGMKPCRKYFDHLEASGVIHRRILKVSQRTRTVFVLGERKRGTQGNADEQRGLRGFIVPFSEYKGERRGTLMNKGLQRCLDEKNIKTKGERRGTLMDKGIEEDILSKIKNKKVIELLKEHPETISRNLTRWFNAYEKRQKAKESDKATSSYPEFSDCVDLYYKFFQNRFGNAPMIDAKFGRSLNAIISAIRTSINNSTSIITPPEHIPIRVTDAFNKILSEWDQYSDFIKNNPTIEAIKGNYNKILSELKQINNGKSTTGKETIAEKRSAIERNYFENLLGKAKARSEEN